MNATADKNNKNAKLAYQGPHLAAMSVKTSHTRRTRYTVSVIIKMIAATSVMITSTGTPYTP